MILSYYDSFLDDDIIDDDYDVVSNGNSFNLNNCESPGILKDSYPHAGNDYTFMELLTYYYLNNDTDFHGSLVCCAFENLFYTEFINNNFYYQNDFAINNLECTYLLQNYIINKTNLTLSEYSISYNAFNSSNSSRSNCKNYIINKLNNHLPVIIAINNGNGGGHFAVAFKYVSADDDIYAHYGSTGIIYNVEPVIFDDTFYIGGVITLEFNKEHNHTNNYIINGTPYCWCNNNCYFVHQTHSFIYSNIDYDTHFESCSCGIARTVPHNYKVIHIPAKGNLSRSIVAYQCRGCGFIRYEPL